MRYTNRTIIVSKSRLSEAEGRIIRQRETVQKLQRAAHPAEIAISLLLVMEQSLLSMKRFLLTLERDIERSLGADKPLRTKVARRLARAKTNEIVQQAAEARRSGLETALHLGKQDKDSAAQVADEFAALAINIVLKETPDLPALSVIAKVRSQPR